MIDGGKAAQEFYHRERASSCKKNQYLTNIYQRDLKITRLGVANRGLVYNFAFQIKTDVCQENVFITLTTLKVNALRVQRRRL